MHATKTTNKSNEFLMMGQKKLAYISKTLRARNHSLGKREEKKWWESWIKCTKKTLRNVERVFSTSTTIP